MAESRLGISKRFKQFLYHNYYNNSFERPYEHRYKKRRNISFHGRYDRSEYLRKKSHSLNAIFEELYSLEPENTSEEGRHKNNYGTRGPLIPRIKLKRSTSSLSEERNFKPLRKMSSESEILIKGNSTPSIIETNVVKSQENKISILLNDEEITQKSDENYFAKNFDDCMKRLQLIEKEHDLIENEDEDLQFCILTKEKENLSESTTTPLEKIPQYEIQCELKNFANELNEAKLIENKVKSETREKLDISENSIPSETAKSDGVLNKEVKEQTPISWNSNHQQQFEKQEGENEEQKMREMSCRITGATLKTQNEKTKSEEDKEKNTRHYYSRLVKSNKTLLDEELPDPDKVRHIRTMFQENLNSTLKKKLDKKLGGSLQNISDRPIEQQMSRPLSAQCYRNDSFPDGCGNQKLEKDKERTKPSRDGKGEFQIENTKKKLFEKYEKDLKPNNRSRRVLQPKWTDTGSVSSGIGSDLSSYDTDLECYSREGTEQDDMIISDDDLPEEGKDKHYVQNEVLEKIRSFGTSITYYGGEMITCSVGPLLSPTTQAIIEEIGEKYGDQSSPVRSFDEFYRKYVETNEHTTKRKLGRTRSFGQNDVFHKPNVLSNTEIEMYKNDLEIEIGIKKPVGMNTLKRKVTKSASLGNNTEEGEKPNEKQVVSINAENLDNSKQNVSDVSSENETTTENVMMNSDPITHSNCQFGETVTEEKIEKEPSDKITPKEMKPEKQNFQKEFFRSKSAPENSSLSMSINSYPAKEIFFSYEKTLFNGKPKSDMEFEEFEVCETLSEKLEKLEKSQDKSEMEEVLSNSEEKQKKPFENTLGEEVEVSLTTPKSSEEKVKSKTPISGGTEKTEMKMNHSRWPIETSVMVDIQKNNEQTPKIITTGKTVAKTKIRLF